MSLQVPNLVFLAVSPEEKELWVNAINAAIIRAKNRVLDEVGGPGLIWPWSGPRSDLVPVLSQWSLSSRWRCRTKAGCFIQLETESRSLKVVACPPEVTCWPWWVTALPAPRPAPPAPPAPLTLFSLQASSSSHGTLTFDLVSEEDGPWGCWEKRVGWSCDRGGGVRQRAETLATSTEPRSSNQLEVCV